MNSNSPLVSIITIFCNAATYIEEAIESVLAQTYKHWELLLVDDGSTDSSTCIARNYAAKYPSQIFYHEHLGHQNRGMAASRNLGIKNALGKYIAFLDADDIYLPNKIMEQVTILESHPDADVVYGNTKYWFSWSGQKDDVKRDFVPNLGVQERILIQPPSLIPLFLNGTAAVPCTCSLLVRSNNVLKTGGFDEDFHGQDIYEDQVFYVKLFLDSTTYVSEKCWDFYRQHADSSMTAAINSGYEHIARRYFLNWLGNYLRENEITNAELSVALRKEQWLNRHYHYPRKYEWIRRTDSLVRWVKKWLLRLEEHVLPSSISSRLWNIPPRITN